MNHLKRFKYSLLLAGICLIPGTVWAQEGGCPDYGGGYGPYDYTNPEHRTQNLPIVETHHFAPSVENLTRGQTGSVAGDLDYTVRAFPNHHRALDAMSKLSIKLKTLRPVGMRCTVDAYFERALRFKPEDAGLHMIYGLHFYRWKKTDQAKQQFEQAAKLAPDDTNIAYNLGLIYADLKEWDKASRYAEKAYSAGFPLPGLRNKLEKAGKWKGVKSAEPKPAAASSDSLNSSRE